MIVGAIGERLKEAPRKARRRELALKAAARFRKHASWQRQERQPNRRREYAGIWKTNGRPGNTRRGERAGAVGIGKGGNPTEREYTVIYNKNGRPSNGRRGEGAEAQAYRKPEQREMKSQTGVDFCKNGQFNKKNKLLYCKTQYISKTLNLHKDVFLRSIGKVRARKKFRKKLICENMEAAARFSMHASWLRQDR